MKRVQAIDRIWKCPICYKKHGLVNVKENKGFFNKSFYIRCSDCETEFEAIYENGKIEKMKLRKEGAKHSALFVTENVSEIEDLRKMFLASLELEEKNIQTSFILTKDEKVFFYEEMDRKNFVKKTETVFIKNKRPVSFFSLFSNKNTGSQTSGYQPVEEIKEIFEKVDSGSFMITDKRMAFSGKKNTFSIALEDILSVGLDEETNVVLGTTNGQLFLDTEKPVKSEIVDTIKFLRK